MFNYGVYRYSPEWIVPFWDIRLLISKATMAKQSIILIITAGFLGFVVLMVLISWIVARLRGRKQAAFSAITNGTMYNAAAMSNAKSKEFVFRPTHTTSAVLPHATAAFRSTGDISGKGSITIKDTKKFPVRMQVVKVKGGKDAAGNSEIV